MERLSSETLGKVLKAEFPSDATCWSQATDEVRDMCRESRLLAGVGEAGAVDFRSFSTPDQWNQHGVEGTVRFYQMLSEQKQKEFCNRFEDWLVSWQNRQVACQLAAKT